MNGVRPLPGKGGQTPRRDAAAVGRAPADERVSDRGLRIFATAASTGNLTAAARRLGIGQPAVSHAISRLERALDTQLLERDSTGVLTTQAGEELLAKIRPAFAQIDEALASTRAARNDIDTVSISVSTSLASWWLLPRLADFKRNNPQISLRLVTADADTDVDISTLDLWIPLGVVERADLDAVTLCEEHVVPVASPALARSLSATDASPKALLEAPLLHLEERYAPRFDWHRWFEHHDVPTPAHLGGDTSTDYSLVLHAALDGQGVALGWGHIVSDLIAEGRLVALAPPVITDTPFMVLSSNRRPLSPGATALRRWLVTQLAR